MIGASEGMDDMSACLAANDIYRFVLYQDGRLIKFDGFQYVETRISRAEMDDFLSDILNELLTDLVTSEQEVISGETLSFVMRQVKHIPVARRMEQNRQNYLVVVCPNFAR